jgi:hypothetical protein
MKYFIALSFLFMLMACTKSSDKTSSSLVGRWKLTETLADPGDGSGTWMPATADYIIQFNKDSTAYENPVNPYRNINRYSVSSDSTLTLFYTNGTSSDFYFKIESNTLTIMGGCIEACGTRYKRTDALLN